MMRKILARNPMDGYNSNDKNIVVIFSDIQLKCEVKEGMEQIERGEYIGIDEAFDRVIAKYAD
jgi:hypothetical protein